MWPPVFWRACLGLVVIDSTRATPILTKISIDPAAALAFPSAQTSGACGIITIDGLGVLNGDYTLLENPNGRRPAWIGATAYAQNRILSYLEDERVWAIGTNNLVQAFSEIDSVTPPAQSSLWQIFNEELSVFEASGTFVTVSCPGEPTGSSPFFHTFHT